MAEPRRVRTQAERDADGNRFATVEDIQRAYRHLLDAPPPPTQCRMHPTAARWMAAHASVKPRALGGPSPALFGIPIVEDLDLPYGEWRLLDADGRVVKRGRFDRPDPDIWMTTESAAPLADAQAAITRCLTEHLPALGEALTEMLAPPRRRWWHRYTRRAL